MATKVLATPGVYIEEKSAFPSSVVAVPTAVPAFIGYTQKAIRGTKDLTNVPTRITSLAEYVLLFGGAPDTTFEIDDKSKPFSLEYDANTRYLLFYAMRLFYSNGGGPCYIVSVGGYDYSKPMPAAPLNDPQNMGGLSALRKEQEPTMVVIPEASLLPKNDCYSLQQQMIRHCGEVMRSRFALLDVYETNFDSPGLTREVINDDFREGIGNDFLQWAASYYPYLETTVVQATEIDYTNISNLRKLKSILSDENDASLEEKFINDSRHKLIATEIKKLKTRADIKAFLLAEKKITPKDDAGPAIEAYITKVSDTLLAVSPVFKDILREIRSKLNILPPSAGMAGVYSSVDNAVGVHKAPANVGMASVVKPMVNLTNEEQEDLNLPLNGKAVNAIRSFVGKGLLVWGARTMDGNSQDWRYINVRRTMIMLEQSIKNAAEAYVFEPNDANTWASIKSMLLNFLTLQWRQGVLVGAQQDDAFRVDLGLGVTMSPVDILDGVMRITVKVAISRPAEFIVITFQQQMQKS